MNLSFDGRLNILFVKIRASVAKNLNPPSRPPVSARNLFLIASRFAAMF